jgi:hypothetical protein
MNAKKVVIVQPSTDRVDALRPHVRTVLDALGVGAAFVTDRSKVGDFIADTEVRARRGGATEAEVSDLVAREESLISRRLGFEVTCATPVWHAAEAVAERSRKEATEE